MKTADFLSLLRSGQRLPEPPRTWELELDQLLGRDPRPLADLLAMLRRRYPTLTEDEVEAELGDRPEFHECASGWVNLLDLADGVVLTHILTPAEREHGVLVADIDLALWARLTLDNGLPLAGSPDLVEGDQTDHGGVLPQACLELHGPQGWLDAFEPTSTIGLRLHNRCFALTSVVPDRVGVDDLHQLVATATDLATAWLHDFLKFRAEADEDKPQLTPGIDIVTVLAETLVAHPGLLREPTLPLGAAILLVGFDLVRGEVGLPGVPWELNEARELTEDEVWGRVRVASSLRVLISRASATREGFLPTAGDGSWLTHDDIDYDRVLADLANPRVRCYAAHAMEASGEGAEVLAGLRAAATTPCQRAVAAYLAACAEAGSGMAASAEALVAQALRDDPRLVPALVDAAEYAATRGDVATATAYLRRAGAFATHPIGQAITEMVREAPAQARRNQPCPCGSGRKHKSCCLARQRQPLHGRLPLIYARLVAWLLRPPNRATFDMLCAMTRPPTPYAEATVMDLALFDSGDLDRYLASHAKLLPDDERELLWRWSTTPIGLYEVTEVAAGGAVTLRPLRGGDPVTVRDHAFARSVSRLELLVARPLDGGGETVLMAPPLAVRPELHQELIQLFDDYSYLRLAMFLNPQTRSALGNLVDLGRTGVS